MLVSLCAHLRAAIVLCRILTLSLLIIAPAAFAGGPRYVAGVTYFNSTVLGQPIHWSGGQLNYYVDQGPLSSTVTNQQAVSMVDAAAALWSAVPTAGVTLTDMGPLNEDVSGANIVASGANFTVANEQTDQLLQIAQPADVTPTATQYPVGVIFDADGSVINALFGSGASDPTSCEFNGVWFWLDNINPDATIAHAIILLNGLCATNSAMLEMMSFELERAFGHILNLDYGQVNPGTLQNGEPGGTQGWPVMQPISGVCGSTGGLCIPQPSVLHFDDIAALNRIYPITAANLSSFPGKQLTATNTVSIQGTVTFQTGLGMQGVNVVARPLDSNGNPLYEYTVTSVSGVSFNGTLLNTPMNTVPIGVPIPFTVTALDPTLTPAGGVTVIYAVASGTATLACGLPTCSVIATGDGRATMNVTAIDGTWSIVTASLTNGSSLQAQFAGGTPPTLASLTPQLSLATGATITWTVQALVLSNGLPVSGQTVAWQSASGITVQGNGSVLTNSNGIATQSLTAGPLTEGQTATINACLNGTSQCITYTVFGARPELATLEVVSGATQSMTLQSTPSQIALRLLDTDGNPMAGGSVSLYQALYVWAPPCASHSVCPPSNLLATQAATATSALDGTVAFAPATLPGVATNLLGLAASGSSSTINISIEQSP